VGTLDQTLTRAAPLMRPLAKRTKLEPGERKYGEE
jgi:hypothetical protein